jgi:ubiquinone/menaquinone biosynthesis C-methylase UbiE
MNDEDFWAEKDYNDADLISHLMQREAMLNSYQLLGNLKDKNILEIGCGSGVQTAEFAKRGGIVTAIDVSDESIKQTQSRCVEHQLSNVTVLKTNVEDLTFSNVFDYVYINNVLMHVKNKDKAIKICREALKPAGEMIIKESLKHWIFSFPYRSVSAYRQTKPDYLSYSFVKNLKCKHKEFYLFSTFFLFLFYTIKNKGKAFRILNAFSKIDQFIFRNFPFTKRFAWVSVARLKK